MSAESPNPKDVGIETNQFDFITAIQHIISGKKIHKLEWEDKEYFGFLNGEILSLHKPDGKNYQWVISLGDLNGKDYILV